MSSTLKTAQSSLKIDSVTLRQSSIVVGEEVDPPMIDRSQTVVQSFRSVSKIKITTLSDDEGNEEWDYRYLYTVGMRLVYESDLEENLSSEDISVLFEVVAIFEAKYLSERELKEEETKAFAKASVGYHVWPYWREYVHSSCSKVGLSPVLEVPLYFMPNNDKSTSERND
jgi:hypothetical protein